MRLLRGELCDGKKCDIYSCSKSHCIDSIKVNDILSAVEEVVKEGLTKSRKPKPGLVDREVLMGVKY